MKKFLRERIFNLFSVAFISENVIVIELKLFLDRFREDTSIFITDIFSNQLSKIFCASTCHSADQGTWYASKSMEIPVIFFKSCKFSIFF